MKQPFNFLTQAGRGIKEIYEAIEGLKALKKIHKKELNMDLDISKELKRIKENLEALICLTEKK